MTDDLRRAVAKTVWTHDLPEPAAAAVVERLRGVDGNTADCAVVVWEQCRALVAEFDRLRAAVLAERERCAGVAEATEAEGVYRQGEDGGSVWDSDAEATKAEIARRIRRGPEPTEGV